MNRRDFLTTSLLATLAAVMGKRDTVQAEQPKPCEGWCLQYISPPAHVQDKTRHNAYIPLATNDH